MALKEKSHKTWWDWIADRILRSLIGAALMLPWETRVRAMGWLTQHVIAPLIGYRKRALTNLNFIYPEMPMAEKRRIADVVTNNTGRWVIETYDTKGLLERTRTQEITGEGLPLIEQAKRDGKPVMFVSGHFGNPEVARAALSNRGIKISGLYRPLANAYFNEHYAKNLESLSGPAFPKGKKGTLGLIRYIAKGGFGILLIDLYFRRGLMVPFLGKPAPTITSAAEIALRTDALLVPFFTTRREDGVSFDIEIERPIPHSTPEEMTIEMTRRLEARVQAKPEQWFWVHRRWSKTL